jgi:hypothetical protein
MAQLQYFDNHRQEWQVWGEFRADGKRLGREYRELSRDYPMVRIVRKSKGEWIG